MTDINENIKTMNEKLDRLAMDVRKLLANNPNHVQLETMEDILSVDHPVARWEYKLSR